MAAGRGWSRAAQVSQLEVRLPFEGRHRRGGRVAKNRNGFNAANGTDFLQVVRAQRPPSAWQAPDVGAVVRGLPSKTPAHLHDVEIGLGWSR